MQDIIDFVAVSVDFMLELLAMLIVLRAVMTVFNGGEGGMLYNMCVSVTEPLIAPFRVLLSKSEAISDSGFDLSSILTYTAVYIVRILLVMIPR